jgi:hypothetical protein
MRFLSVGTFGEKKWSGTALNCSEIRDCPWREYSRGIAVEEYDMKKTSLIILEAMLRLTSGLVSAGA